jgi:hypothetical protein
MRIGLIAHGVLAAAALLFAYQTWTRDKTEKPKVGDHVVWNKGPVKAIVYSSKKKTTRIEKRSDDGGEFFWGIHEQTRRAPKPGAPPANPHGAPPANPHGAPPANPHGAPPAPMPPKPAPKAPAAAPKAAPAKPAPKAPAAPKPASGGPDFRLGTGGPQPDPAEKPPAKPAPKAAPAKAAPAKASPPPAADEASSEAAAGAAESSEMTSTEEPKPEEPETITVTSEFPVGEAGENLFELYANLKAMRALGKLDEEKLKEYELNESEENLTILFEDGSQKTLILGKKVYRGADRFVLDNETDEAYVLAGDLLKGIDGGQSGLSLKKLHTFEEDEIGEVKITTEKGEREFIRTKGEKDGREVIHWADKADAMENNQTVGNFLDRLGKLKPVEYDTERPVSDLIQVCTVRFFNKHGKELGHTEFYRLPPDKQEPDSSGKRQTHYYVSTERTHSLGKTSRLAAERVDQDAVQIFGIDPAPSAIDDAPKMPGQIEDSAPLAPGQEESQPKGATQPKPAAPKPAAPKPAAPKPAAPKPAAPKPAAPKPAAPKPAAPKPAAPKPAAPKPASP